MIKRGVVDRKACWDLYSVLNADIDANFNERKYQCESLDLLEKTSTKFEKDTSEMRPDSGCIIFRYSDNRRGSGQSERVMLVQVQSVRETIRPLTRARQSSFTMSQKTGL